MRLPSDWFLIIFVIKFTGVLTASQTEKQTLWQHCFLSHQNKLVISDAFVFVWPAGRRQVLCIACATTGSWPLCVCVLCVCVVEFRMRNAYVSLVAYATKTVTTLSPVYVYFGHYWEHFGFLWFFLRWNSNFHSRQNFADKWSFLPAVGYFLHRCCNFSSEASFSFIGMTTLSSILVS